MDHADAPRELAGRLVCWDLDKTLGVFRPLGAAPRPSGARPPGPEQGLRPHVLEVIDALDRAGAIQVITTASTPDHAERSLRRAGARRYFRRVYTGDDLVPIYGVPTKDYTRVAHDFGLFGPEVSARMIVIGDTLTLDLPTSGPVFVWERAGAHVSARLTLWILATLAAAGDGDFLAGYEAFNRAGGAPASLLGGELSLGDAPGESPGAGRRSFILKLWKQSGAPVISLLSELGPLPLEPLPR
ncbi:MAG: HAD family hydrolase [Myxococcales bacterium]|nr:HAD family hydrolase [Myxococcales bacterium]